MLNGAAGPIPPPAAPPPSRRTPADRHGLKRRPPCLTHTRHRHKQASRAWRWNWIAIPPSVESSLQMPDREGEARRGEARNEARAACRVSIHPSTDPTTRPPARLPALSVYNKTCPSGCYSTVGGGAEDATIHFIPTFYRSRHQKRKAKPGKLASPTAVRPTPTQSQRTIP